MTTVAEASKRYASLCRASKMGHARSKQIVDDVNSFPLLSERIVYLNEIRLNVELFLHDVNEMRRNPQIAEVKP